MHPKEAKDLTRYAHVPYRRLLDHPVETAFAWLTDFDDGDGDRAGAVLAGRRVLERTDRRVVVENRHKGFARRGSGIGEATLEPPDRWRARVVNDRGLTVMKATYRLEPRDGGERSELIIDYHFATPRLRYRLLFDFFGPFVRRELSRMWDGYVAAMDRELSAPEATGRADS